MSDKGNPLAARLKRLRRLRGFSTVEAAKLIGVPPTTYREWEYGRQITGEPYPDIARAFEVTLDELFGNDPSNTSLESDFGRLEILLKAIKKKALNR